ncbi:MAG: hypothetical protein N2234_10760, partial [Planctomycetota bacterium]|nr:hypothetical protein [Planctomycetota bacterium]
EECRRNFKRRSLEKFVMEKSHILLVRKGDHSYFFIYSPEEVSYLAAALEEYAHDSRYNLDILDARFIIETLFEREPIKQLEFIQL